MCLFKTHACPLYNLRSYSRGILVCTASNCQLRAFKTDSQANPIRFEINLTPDTPQLRAAIEEDLRKLIFSDSRPLRGLRRNDVVVTLEKYVILDQRVDLLEPRADVIDGPGQMATFGEIHWVEVAQNV